MGEDGVSSVASARELGRLPQTYFLYGEDNPILSQFLRSLGDGSPGRRPRVRSRSAAERSPKRLTSCAAASMHTASADACSPDSPLTPCFAQSRSRRLHAKSASASPPRAPPPSPVARARETPAFCLRCARTRHRERACASARSGAARRRFAARRSQVPYALRSRSIDRGGEAPSSKSALPQLRRQRRDKRLDDLCAECTLISRMLSQRPQQGANPLTYGHLGQHLVNPPSAHHWLHLPEVIEIA